MKKSLKLLLVALSLVTVLTLAACSKYTKEGIPKDLKESYSGTTEGIGYTTSAFNDDSGKDTLKFNTKKHIITNSDGERIYFKVITEKDLSKIDNVKNYKKVYNSHKSDYEGKTHFLIKADPHKEDLKNDRAGIEVYCIVLSDNGKSMHLFQLENDAQYEYFDFKGTAN
ncbi:amino acid transporter [Streptococcus dentasini]